VFDILGTEGAELPQLGEVKGDARGQLARLINYHVTQGIKFGYSEEIAPAERLLFIGDIRGIS